MKLKFELSSLIKTSVITLLNNLWSVLMPLVLVYIFEYSAHCFYGLTILRLQLFKIFLLNTVPLRFVAFLSKVRSIKLLTHSLEISEYFDFVAFILLIQKCCIVILTVYQHWLINNFFRSWTRSQELSLMISSGWIKPWCVPWRIA